MKSSGMQDEHFPQSTIQTKQLKGCKAHPWLQDDQAMSVSFRRDMGSISHRVRAIVSDTWPRLLSKKTLQTCDGQLHDSDVMTINQPLGVNPLIQRAIEEKISGWSITEDTVFMSEIKRFILIKNICPVELLEHGSISINPNSQLLTRVFIFKGEEIFSLAHKVKDMKIILSVNRFYEPEPFVIKGSLNAKH
jgi:hypothetical protein